eukprot:12285745-Alexandrium_andersonii.AAC.1
MPLACSIASLAHSEQSHFCATAGNVGSFVHVCVCVSCCFVASGCVLFCCVRALASRTSVRACTIATPWASGISLTSTARRFDRVWDARMRGSFRTECTVASAPVRLQVGGRRHRSQAMQ